MMNAMLKSSWLPQNIQGKVVLLANYLLTKVPQKDAKKKKKKNPL